MIVSSTEFQQNVGLYLKEAQNGKTIYIKKHKPEQVVFELTVKDREPVQKTGRRKFTREQIATMIAKANIHDAGSNRESGLEFQKRVRS